MLVYICDSLNTTDPGGLCDDVSAGLSSCLGSTLIAAWAVGGQVIRLICIVYLYCYWIRVYRILYFLPILHMAWEVTVSDMQ